MLALARQHHTGAAQPVERLAADQGIPPNYLVQILIELKARRILKSVRGREGGYLLARPPAQITFADVLSAVHGEVFDAAALSNPQCPPELRAAWQTVKRAFEEAAEGINFQQLLEQAEEKQKMYYI